MPQVNEYVSIDLVNSTDDKDEHYSYYALELLKPRIVTPLPKEVFCNLNDKLNLVCITTVLFPTEVEWYLNGKSLKACENGIVFFENKNREVIFPRMTNECFGTLTCIATNMFGLDQCHCRIKLSKNENIEGA